MSFEFPKVQQGQIIGLPATFPETSVLDLSLSLSGSSRSARRVFPEPCCGLAMVRRSILSYTVPLSLKSKENPNPRRFLIPIRVVGKEPLHLLRSCFFAD